MPESTLIVNAISNLLSMFLYLILAWPSLKTSRRLSILPGVSAC
jgi:hypothetical protein